MAIVFYRSGTGQLYTLYIRKGIRKRKEDNQRQIFCGDFIFVNLTFSLDSYYILLKDTIVVISEHNLQVE
jgi:hypothetical protein